MSLYAPGVGENVVIAASAGTGKTHQLTNVYLAHALGLTPDARSITPEHIAATTFSRAAAQEIRERLEQRLAPVALGSSPSLGDPGLDRLAAHLARGELTRRAAHALLRLPRSTIDTLHGLSAMLLRRYAFELGLPADFAILEEYEAWDDAERVVDDVLAKALAESPPRAAAALRLIDSCHGLERARSEIVKLLGRLDEEGLSASDLEASAEHEAIEQLLQELELACAMLAGGASPLAGPARRVRELLASPQPDPAELGAALVELAKIKATPKIKAVAGWHELDRVLARIIKKNRKQAALAVAHLLGERERIDQDARGIIELLSAIQCELRGSRRARGALGFSDLLVVARDGLRDHPEIARAARAGIELLLVDEFQDTSRIQRDLLMLLCERPEQIAARAAGSLPTASDLSPHGLVIVGDRKQSIYGFRGADVSVFAKLAAELAGDAAAEALDLRGVEASAEPVARFHALTENWRSLPSVIDAINLIAERDFERDPRHAFEIRYTESERLRPPSAAPPVGAGTVTLVSDDGRAPRDVAPLISAASGPLRTALVAAAFCAAARGEGSSFKDIAVLARRRATLPLVELGLERLGIPYVVSGRALYRTQEVRDVFAALRLALDGHDRHALAVVARGPLGGLADATLAELSDKDGLRPASAWSDVEVTHPAERALVLQLAERLACWIQTAPRLSPRDAIAFAIEHFELEQVLSALPRAQVRLGNIGRLLDIAGRHGGSLAAFVRWLDRQVTIDVDEAEAAVFSDEDDAVRLLTIHASKGLSFGIVIVLDLEVKEAGFSPPLTLMRAADGRVSLVVRHRGPEGSLYTPCVRLAQDDANARAKAERQRLSYVALTRAERELVLVVPAGKPRSESLGQTLASLVDDGSFDALRGARRLDAATLLEAAPPPPAQSEPEPPAAPPRPLSVACRRLAIGATALADFVICPRRFQLLHVARVVEPDLPWASSTSGDEDPRALGRAAHRALERWPLKLWGKATDPERVLELLAQEGMDPGSEAALASAAGIARFLSGDFARSLCEPGVTAYREHSLMTPLSTRNGDGRGKQRRKLRHNPMQLSLFSDATSSCEPREQPNAWLLKTTFDLIVTRSDASIDIVDYKRSRGGESVEYALQLAAYAFAAKQHFGATRVRAGLVYLLAPSAEPTWLDLAAAPDFASHVQSLAACRWQDQWPFIERARCVKARCGFVSTCHPPGS